MILSTRQGSGEIALDRGREISHRYFATSKLAKADSLNPRWPELVTSILSDHDFSLDPDLSFTRVAEPLDGAQLRAYFKVQLFAKINRSRETGAHCLY